MEDLNELLKKVEIEFPDDDTIVDEDSKEDIDNNETTDTDGDDDSQEIVGNDEKDDDSQESTGDSEQGSSPNVFSSIASVLRDEGAFLDITDEDIENLTDVDSFVNFIKEKKESSIGDSNRAIKKALESGVQPNEINTLYSNYKAVTEDIDEDLIRDEEGGENLRKTLIITDFMERGYSPEKAEKMYNKSFKAGDEIDDAVEAWESLKTFYTNQVKQFEAAQKNIELQRRAEAQKQEENFRKNILENEKLFGDFEVSKKLRESIYDSVRVKKHKTQEGKLTDIQKWTKEDPDGFLAAAGLLYTLTNGGKDFSKLLTIKNTKKEISKARKDLENALRSTTYDDNGSLRVLNGYNTKKDKNSKYSDFDIAL